MRTGCGIVPGTTTEHFLYFIKKRFIDERCVAAGIRLLLKFYFSDVYLVAQYISYESFTAPAAGAGAAGLHI